MAGSHYQIVKLKSGVSIQIMTHGIAVDLDHADMDHPISNDEEFLNCISRETFFWVSGGGTYLLNKRYLILVKRGDSAIVNAGKYSLFTGRANSLEEILNPTLLIRELFEELILFSDEGTYYPICKEYQGIIDEVYQDLSDKFELEQKRFKYLNLHIINDFNRTILLKHSGNAHEFRLNFHINSRNDINILFLLSAHLDISDLSASDGEYHISGQEIVRHNRKIYLYDILNSKAKEITDGAKQESIIITYDKMTEHLNYLINQLQTEMKGHVT